ncbi:MAG: hypothetical protein ACREDY_00020 [Bradyrhizobium sp.]
MSEPPRRSATDELHPAVYTALMGLVLWFVIAIWGFSGNPYVDWLLVVVSGFALISTAIPVILSRVGRDRRQGRRRQRFLDWASGDFATWRDLSSARNAAVEDLLPLGAAAIGMTAIAIVFMVEQDWLSTLNRS